MHLIYRDICVLFFFFLLLLIFLGFFGGEGVGFRLERSTSFFPLAFSFEVIFVLSTKTGLKPDCYAGLKKVLGSSCAPRDLFSWDHISVQQLTEALQKTDYGHIWQPFESLCMSTTVLRSRVTEISSCMERDVKSLKPSSQWLNTDKL